MTPAGGGRMGPSRPCTHPERLQLLAGRSGRARGGKARGGERKAALEIQVGGFRGGFSAPTVPVRRTSFSQHPFLEIFQELAGENASAGITRRR